MDGRLRCPVRGCERTFPSRFALCSTHWKLLGSLHRKAITDEYHCMNSPFNSCSRCSFTSNDSSKAVTHGDETGHPVRFRKTHDHDEVYQGAVAAAVRSVEILLMGQRHPSQRQVSATRP